MGVCVIVNFLSVPFTYFILLGISALFRTESYNFPHRRLNSASMVQCTYHYLLMRAADAVQLLSLPCAKDPVFPPPSLETLAKQQTMSISGQSKLFQKIRKAFYLYLLTQVQATQPALYI